MKSVLRWLVLIPASLLGGWLAYIAVKSINLATSPDGASRFFAVCVETTATMAMGGGSILVAHRMAPRRKLMATLVVFALIILSSGVMLAFSFMSADYAAAFNVAMLLVGSGVAVFDLYRRHSVRNASDVAEGSGMADRTAGGHPAAAATERHG